MNISISECYRILELELDATEQEVDTAYRNLVFIWHPDRIPPDHLNLIKKAQEKLKRINAARETVLRHLQPRANQKSPLENDLSDGHEPEAGGNNSFKPSGFEHQLRRRPKMFGEMDSEFQRVFRLHYSYSEHYDLGVHVWRPNMSVKNRFQKDGNDVVSDYATGLMWQEAGFVDPLNYNDAHGYIHSLNYSQYQGYDDWRLPTIEELMSLWSEWNEQDRYFKGEYIGTAYAEPYIDPVFAEEQSVCWSADVPSPGTDYSCLADNKLERRTVKNPTDAAWTINFSHFLLTGSIIAAFDRRNGVWIKAVRSIS